MRKVWLTLYRERAVDAAPIARCTVERLMSELGQAWRYLEEEAERTNIAMVDVSALIWHPRRRG